jgi:hypothetical protein
MAAGDIFGGHGWRYKLTLLVATASTQAEQGLEERTLR